MGVERKWPLHLTSHAVPTALFFLWLHRHRLASALAETNPACHARHARRSASSGRSTPTAGGSSARRRLLTTRRPRPSRATSGVHRRLPPTHRTMPKICRRRFSTTPTRRTRSKWKQHVDQDEQPVPKVEEEEAPAAKPRSGAGTASSSASKSGEKEKTSVLALLRHVHLPYSVASDEKLLETSHGLGTGGPASHYRAGSGWPIGQGEEKYGTLGRAG